MKRTLLSLMAGVSALVTIVPATAQLSLTLQPAATTASLGGQTSVDVIVSGLTPPPGLAGFAIGLNYDGTLVSPVAVSYGTSLGNALTDDDLTTNPLFVSSVSLETEQSFFDAQPASFVLVTLTFDGLALGTSPLSFDSGLTSLTDENANSLDFTTAGGQITVVPEAGPVASAVVMLSAAFGLVVYQRRRCRREA